jgi:hypothetical protein
VALVPTLLAILVGLGLGLRWGGRIDHLLGWRPALPAALIGGLAFHTLAELAALRGGVGTVVAVLGLAGMLVFAVVNVRTGGMVLVVAGLGLDLLVTVVNWGTPVSSSALASAGVIDPEATGSEVVLTGGRQLADGAFLGFLGDVIPLPWGQVLSIGDLLVLVGIALVTASVVRRYEVRGGVASTAGRRHAGPSGRRSAGGASDYRSALDALGRGPAPRRGPGLHPSRLDERRRPARKGNRARLRPVPGPGERRPSSGRPGSTPR